MTGWWEKKHSHPKIHYMFFEDMVEVSSVTVRVAILNQGFVFPRDTWNDEAYTNMTNRPGVYRVKVCVRVCVCLFVWAQDTGREINKLCSFLGLTSTTKEKEQIRHQSQFDNMKKDDMANYSTVEVMDFKISPFMRKGNSDNLKNESL